jgi:hypothetical protein
VGAARGGVPGTAGGVAALGASAGAAGATAGAGGAVSGGAAAPGWLLAVSAAARSPGRSIIKPARTRPKTRAVGSKGANIRMDNRSCEYVTKHSLNIICGRAGRSPGRQDLLFLEPASLICAKYKVTRDKDQK